MRWQVEDVRAVTIVARVDRQAIHGRCGFCEQSFSAPFHISLSVARNGVGGETVDLCQACARANWDALLVRLDEVVAMLSVVDGLQAEAGGI